MAENDLSDEEWRVKIMDQMGSVRHVSGRFLTEGGEDVTQTMVDIFYKAGRLGDNHHEATLEAINHVVILEVVDQVYPRSWAQKFWDWWRKRV